MIKVDELKYYALFDIQLDGFIGGYADSRLDIVVENAFERIVELSESNEEPYNLHDDPIDVFDVAGYEIHLVDEKAYRMIIEGSNLRFLSDPIRGINNSKRVDLVNLN